jgi:hypothetical protein
MAWTFSVLVVANVTATSPELLAALEARAERDTCRFTLLVPAPAAGAVGREAAQARLDEALELLQTGGLDASGEVGNHDPIGAVSDIWDPSRFDEVVVSTLPTGVSKWLQVDLPGRIRRTTDAQVTHVVAEPERAPPHTEPVGHVENYGVLAPLAALSGKRPERTS